MEKRLLLAAWVIVLGVFLFTRLYNLSDRFFFFNDIGRDFLVLWDWKTTGKPPLLGPQNSVMPFNQSAVYFYWLMPVYLLTGGSYYSSVYTVILTYVVILGGLAWLLRKNRYWQYVLLAFSWLIALHPATLEQTIFVWNPSFVTPFLVTALVSWWQYHLTVHRSWLIALGISTGLSLGFSYSVIPVFFVLAVVVIAVERWKSWRSLISMVIGTIALQLPTFAFEARHGFLLTNAVIRWIGAGAPDAGSAQPPTIAEKFSNLLLYTLGTSEQIVQLLIGILFVVSVTWHVLTVYKRHSKLRPQEKLFLLVVVILVLTVTVTLLLPIPVHAHYIFGFVTLFFLSIAMLPKWSKISLVALLTLVWLTPSRLLPNFAPAPRTVTESVTCAQQVCASEAAPVFVSVQSSLHPYHTGPDWRYLLTANGCQVKSLETEPHSANTMLVVEEFSEYTHGSTAFNELTLFGESNLARTHTCSEDIRVYALDR